MNTVFLMMTIQVFKAFGLIQPVLNVNKMKFQIQEKFAINKCRKFKIARLKNKLFVKNVILDLLLIKQLKKMKLFVFLKFNTVKIKQDPYV